MLESFHSNIVDVHIEEKIQPIPEEARKLLMQMNEKEIDKEEIAKFQTIKSFKTHYIHKTPLGEFKLEDGLQSEGTLAVIRCLTLSKNNIGQTYVNQGIVRKIHKNTKLRQAYLTGKFTTMDPNEPDIDLDSEYKTIESLLFTTDKKGGEV